MTETELLKIATDICIAANRVFANKIPINDKKWVINSEEPDIKTLINVPLYHHAILGAIYSLTNNHHYIKLIEYIENIDGVKGVISIAGDHTQPKRLAENLVRNTFILLPSEPETVYF